MIMKRPTQDLIDGLHFTNSITDKERDYVRVLFEKQVTAIEVKPAAFNAGGEHVKIAIMYIYIYINAVLYICGINRS